MVKRNFLRSQHVELPMITDWLNVPDAYRLTVFGQVTVAGHKLHREQFFLHVAQPAAHPRMIILMSDSAARHLSRCPVVCMDGTFKVVPKGYSQLYTGIGYNTDLRQANTEQGLPACHGEYVPAFYAIMMERTLPDYRVLFREIRRAIERVTGGGIGRIEAFMMDFEPAVARALSEEFPEVRRLFCIFHYEQVGNFY
jgi:hypothetical protein